MDKRFRHAIRCCFAVARGPFWKPDACSLEPPNVNKFEHGFGTQLGAVLLWRRVRSRGFGTRSRGLMLAAWSHQTTTAGGRQKTFFLGIQKGRWGVFVDKLAQKRRWGVFVDKFA